MLKTARNMLGEGHERADRKMQQVHHEHNVGQLKVVAKEGMGQTSSYSSLEALPLDMQLFTFSFMTIEDLCEMTQTSKLLRHEFVEPYLRGMRKFIAEEQEGKLLNLMLLLRRKPNLESLIIDTKLTIASGPSYFRSHSLFLAKCFQMLNPNTVTTLILKGCLILNQDSVSVISNQFHNLTALDLSYMHQLKDSVLKKMLANNPQLVYLCLEKCYNAVNIYSLLHLAEQCPSLKTVSLSYCSNVDDRCIHTLAKLKHLQELSLAHCYDISADAMNQFCKQNKSMTILSLEWCFNMDDDFLLALSESCSKLQILGVEHCGRFSDQSLGHLISQCPNLQFLSMDGCNQSSLCTARSLKDKGLLKDLFLNTCNLINDESVKAFISSCRQLVSLGIEECSITDESVKMIAKCCPNIRVLGLNGNAKVGDIGIEALIRFNVRLQKLYVSDTSVTGKGVKALAKHAQDLRSLSLVGCQVNLAELMVLGDPINRCSRTLQDLHLSSAQYSAFYLQAAMQQLHPSKEEEKIRVQREEQSESVAESSVSTLLDDIGLHEEVENALDLRKIIFTSRELGIPADRCCRIYYR